MKRGRIFILILFLMPIISAASINTKASYDIGETIIAPVYGNFVTDLSEENVFFYRQSTYGGVYVQIPMSYDVAKVGDTFYIKASLIGKNPGNYSIKIKNIYYYSGGTPTNEEITQKFTISQTLADFYTSPGFYVGSNNFSFKVTSLQDTPLIVFITKPSGVSAANSVSLGSNQEKTITFDISDMSEDIDDFIKLSTSNTEYNVPIFLTYVPEPPPVPEPYCGDGLRNANEQCDGDDWGTINNCEDFNYNSGFLSCNAPGSTNECTFDISNCYNTTSQEGCIDESDCEGDQICVNGQCIDPLPENPYCGDGVITSGEQCDGTNWGAVTDCTFFNYDKGTLICNSPGSTNECKFDLSNCKNNDLPEPKDCEKDNQCNKDEICEDNKCIEGCRVDGDCGEEYCENNLCVECKKDDHCDGDLLCVDNECVECEEHDDCRDIYGEDYYCHNGECEQEVECETDFQCRNNYTCVDEKCVQKQCLADYYCDIGFDCIDWFCRLAKGTQCVNNNDSQCNNNSLMCVNGNCVPKGSGGGNQADRTCAEIGGFSCAEGYECKGESISLSGISCCKSSCEKVSSSSLGKYIGWILLAGILIFLIWFFLLKKKKTTKSPPKFLSGGLLRR